MASAASRKRADRTAPPPPTKTPDLPDPVGDYARDVLAGKIIAGKWVKLACKRHLTDLEKGPKRGLFFSRSLALRAIEFFPTALVHYQGQWAGQPFVLMNWQQFVVGNIYGWINLNTGYRRFSHVYEEEARKNGKSAKCAGIALYALTFDNENAPQVFTAATKRDQAKIVWNDAEKFVRRSRALRPLVQVLANALVCASNDGVMTALSADATTMDGLNPHAVVIDELHRHRNRSVVDVMSTATGARNQPLQYEITTAGDDVHGICYEHHLYTRRVLEGLFPDDSWFGIIFALDEDDDWHDETLWVKANPNLGVSKSWDYMRTQYKRACNDPGFAPEFKRLHLGLWNQQVGGWLSMEKWDACAELVTLEQVKGEDCFVGLDLSSTTDLTARVALFPPTPKRPKWGVLGRYWVPGAKVEAARQNDDPDRVPYHLWADAGLIEETEGNVIDYTAVFKDIEELAKHVAIREIGYDPWNATQLANELMAAEFNCVEVRQGFKTLSEPSKKLHALVLNGELSHGGQPVLRWMASNVSVAKDDAENIKPSKKISRHRIDGIVALINALSRAIANDNDDGRSVYEDREMIVL